MLWPSFDPTIFLNILISAAIGSVFSLIGYLIGDIRATQRERRAEKWQELQYWRSRFDTLDNEVQKIARTDLAYSYVFSDDLDDSSIGTFTPFEQRDVQDARRARQRIKDLCRELMIEDTLPNGEWPKMNSSNMGWHR